MRYLLVLLVLASLAALFVAALLGWRAGEPPRASPCEDPEPARSGGAVTFWTDGDDFL